MDPIETIKLILEYGVIYGSAGVFAFKLLRPNGWVDSLVTEHKKFLLSTAETQATLSVTTAKLVEDLRVLGAAVESHRIPAGQLRCAARHALNFAKGASVEMGLSADTLKHIELAEQELMG